MARPHAIIALFLALSGCYDAHGTRDDSGTDTPDAGTDAPDGGSSCMERTPELMRFESLRCGPEVFELPAEEIDLAPGPCPSTRPTTTPFVSAGVWPALGSDREVRDACIRVTSASEESGVIVGSVIDSWAAAIAVPFDAADVEYELIGHDTCGRMVHGRRRVRSSMFEGPRLVVASEEPVLAVADRCRAPDWIAYATADQLFLDDGEPPIAADHAREIIYGSTYAWLEGTEATVLRDESGASLPVDRDARLLRPPNEWSELVVVEPGRVRLLESDGLHEVSAFSIPSGASSPAVVGRAIALQIGDQVRVWDLDTGAERTGRGFLPGDRLLPALPSPFIMRGTVLERVPLEGALRAPPFAASHRGLDADTHARIGPILTAMPMMFDDPVLVVGERGIGVMQETLEADAVEDVVYSAMERLGGPIRLARTTWQFESVIVVDTPDGRSSIYDVGHDETGWVTPCDVWE